MAPLFELQNVRYQTILSYPNLHIEDKQTTFIIGKSGCGKSTLLKFLNRTLSPTSGVLLYKGQDIQKLEPIALRQEVLLVSQAVYLFDKTIEENFEEYYHYRDLSIPSKETIQYFLALCGADFPLDTLCTSMSGGERQRIYLAIFLSFMPRVLLLDEPTSALDSQSSQLVLNNLKSFCKEKSISLIIVSHDQSLTHCFADKTIILER
ncbi:ABC transporter [Sporanaerobium hydrogeniformans]|uniref:ABC transporter n=1 Tax=Sporanaerobium hydrogeniformans TaxID=3072179 RepID=A0AC61DBJ2_9FIRM|nr:ATP-binding cassette domain-containing protein [Sporanaerobium hydrogeniformans]PHV70120.1 ABC transporter [Sporanaerobium hydrogeniformans]